MCFFALASKGGEGWMPGAGKGGEGGVEVMGATSPNLPGQMGGCSDIGSGNARPEPLSSCVCIQDI